MIINEAKPTLEALFFNGQSDDGPYYLQWMLATDGKINIAPLVNSCNTNQEQNFLRNVLEAWIIINPNETAA
jgi:hypothetical protein